MTTAQRPQPRYPDYCCLEVSVSARCTVVLCFGVVVVFVRCDGFFKQNFWYLSFSEIGLILFAAFNAASVAGGTRVIGVGDCTTWDTAVLTATCCTVPLCNANH